MVRVMFRVLLYNGLWKRNPTEKAIESILNQSLSGKSLVDELEFVQPSEDVAFEIEFIVDVDVVWGDPEHIRDEIIERLLHKFEPEFESMVEVEVEDAC